MLKWKLTLTTLPYVIAVVAAKAVLQYGFDFHGIIKFSDVGWILTGGIFLMGLMLAGTLSDYKESEKIPGEIACCLETIEETFVQAARSKSLDLPALRKTVLDNAESALGWLHRSIDTPAMYRSIEKLDEAIAGLESAGATPLGVRALNELSSFRKAITRIKVISETGFLSSGYAILDILVVIVILVMLISGFDNHLSEMIMMTFVPLVYIYLRRLIRDIDNPFEYASGRKKNADEIPLSPIEDYRDRLRARCG